jgi:ABC-type transporter Mla subunit MlaD
VQIGRVLDVFDADVRPRIRAAIDNLGRGLGDRGPQFRAALVELAPFLETAKRLNHEYAVRDVQARRLTHNLSLITGELARRDGQVTRLVSAGNSTLGELASVEGPLGELIDQLPPTLVQMPRSFATLRAAADELDPTFTALRPTARALPAALQALDRFGPQLQAGAAALRRPLPRLTSLMRVTRPVAAQLKPAFATLNPQTPRLDRITAALVPCEPAIQAFLQWTLSVGKYHDARTVQGRGDAVRGLYSTGEAKDNGLTWSPTCAKGAPRR